MKVLFLIAMMVLLAGCLEEGGGKSGRPILDPDMQLIGAAIDGDKAYVKSSILRIDAMTTKFAYNTVVVFGDNAVCEEFKLSRCQGIKATGKCAPYNHRYLEFSKVMDFDMGSIPTGTEKDFSVYFTNGANHGPCYSYKVSIDTTPVAFTVDHAFHTTRNPLLSPVLNLNYGESDICKGTGIPDDVGIGKSRISKIEIGVGLTTSSPNVIAFSEIDKSLLTYEIPMTGLILSEGQKFYTFVRVTDFAGNAQTKVTNEWYYRAADIGKSHLLVTLDDGRFGVYDTQSVTMDFGSPPYTYITVMGEALKLLGEVYFFGKTDGDTQTHIFKYDPMSPLGIINPMNLTFGLVPLPGWKPSLTTHKGRIYFIGDKKLMEFNPAVPVSGTNPKEITQADDLELESFLFENKGDLYFNAINTLTAINAVYKINPRDPTSVPGIYTSAISMAESKTLDRCNYFVKGGATLEDVLHLKIHEPLDQTNPDPALRNPRFITSGPDAMKGSSFMEGQFYFNSGSLPYRGPDFLALSLNVDASDFVKCNNQIFNTYSSPATGKELGIFVLAQPLSVTNPGLHQELFAGPDNGIDTWLGCGLDSKVYFTGRLDGDSLAVPLSLLMFDPAMVPSITNPAKVPDEGTNFIRAAIAVP